MGFGFLLTRKMFMIIPINHGNAIIEGFYGENEGLIFYISHPGTIGVKTIHGSDVSQCIEECKKWIKENLT